MDRLREALGAPTACPRGLVVAVLPLHGVSSLYMHIAENRRARRCVESHSRVFLFSNFQSSIYSQRTCIQPTNLTGEKWKIIENTTNVVAIAIPTLATKGQNVTESNGIR